MGYLARQRHLNVIKRCGNTNISLLILTKNQMLITGRSKLNEHMFCVYLSATQIRLQTEFIYFVRTHGKP